MIYIAEHKDLPVILKLAKAAAKGDTFDEEVAAVCIYNNWLTLPIFVWRKTPEDPIEGFIGLRFVSTWCSKEQFVADYCYFARTSEVVAALFDAMKDFAKLNKLKVSSLVYSKTPPKSFQEVGLVVKFDGAKVA